MSIAEQVGVNRVPVIPGMSIVTVKLIERLKEGKIGEVLTDSELRELCGKETAPGGNGYTYLHSAIRYVIRNHGVVWQRVWKAGQIKCLNAGETVDASKSDLRHAGKISRRGLMKLKAVPLESVAEADRTEYLTTRAQLGMVANFAGADAAKRIASSPIADSDELRRRQVKMLEAFGQNGK